MAVANNPRTAGRYLTDESYVLETQPCLQSAAGAETGLPRVPADLMFARELAIKVMEGVGQVSVDAIAEGAHDPALGSVRKMLDEYARVR